MSEEQSINMSDISNKESSNRYASAMCEVVVNREIIDKITNRSLPKGDIIAAAKLAGILAVKKNSRNDTALSCYSSEQCRCRNCITKYSR